jgi:hypothetical protein
MNMGRNVCGHTSSLPLQFESWYMYKSLSMYIIALKCNSGKLKDEGEEVGKGISEREAQRIRLVRVLWH